MNLNILKHLIKVLFPLFFVYGLEQVKNLRLMQETQKLQVWSLVWENPLKEEMVAYSSILALKNPMDRGS